MKVKEILEILSALGKPVTDKELLGNLENVGIVANLETDIEPIVIKKLSKIWCGHQAH